MPSQISNTRLPRTFHQSFKPERQYISAMLRYAASGKQGDFQSIAKDTGIPTGSASGKVPAIMDYCRGMGLILEKGQNRSAIKKPELTSFGRIVLLEDPYLKESVSQWISHFNLCSSLTGADVWYQTFFPGTRVLGMSFERSKLETYLSLIYGVEKTDLVGPLIGMYEDDAAFRTCGVLSVSSGKVVRKPAPLSDECGYAYGAWLLQVIVNHFPTVSQISLTDLDAKSGWRTIPGWDITSQQLVLQLIERKGLIDVDRHMEPWLIQPAATIDEAWKKIYLDLV